MIRDFFSGWKFYKDQFSERLVLLGIMEAREHYVTMEPRGLRGALNWAPITHYVIMVPRGLRVISIGFPLRITSIWYQGV